MQTHDEFTMQRLPCLSHPGSSPWGPLSKTTEDSTSDDAMETLMIELSSLDRSEITHLQGRGKSRLVATCVFGFLRGTRGYTKSQAKQRLAGQCHALVTRAINEADCTARAHMFACGGRAHAETGSKHRVCGGGGVSRLR